MLTSLYIDGNSPLHRIPAGWKLTLLFAASIILYLFDDWRLLVSALLSATAAYLSVGISPREALRRITPALFTIVILCALNAWFTTPQLAFAMFLRLSSIVTFAAAVTASMKMADFMEALTTALKPLEKLGLVNAADLGLALGLVLRFVPEVFSDYQAIRQAHQARGLPLRWHTIIGPLMVLTLKNADTVSEAIDARGIRHQASIGREII